MLIVVNSVIFGNIV